MRKLIIEQINFLGSENGYHESPQWNSERYKYASINNIHISKLSESMDEVSDEDLVQLLVSVARLAFKQR